MLLEKIVILGKLKILSKHHTSYDVLSDHLTDKGSLITSDLLSDNEHVFYKERTIAEDGLDQRLISTFSLKYKAYRENLRNNRVKRASKIIRNGTYDSENELSPKNLIKTTYMTESGEEATISSAEIDLEKV